MKFKLKIQHNYPHSVESNPNPARYPILAPNSNPILAQSNPNPVQYPNLAPNSNPNITQSNPNPDQYPNLAPNSNPNPVQYPNLAPNSNPNLAQSLINTLTLHLISIPILHNLLILQYPTLIHFSIPCPACIFNWVSGCHFQEFQMVVQRHA